MIEFTISKSLLAGWQVLVVDDELDSTQVVQTLLKMCGAEVLVSNNGQAGYDLALKHRPRFIISDISMPDMTGWQLLERLKKTLATRDIPVIALTAHARTTDRQQAFAAGFHNYLAKPLRPETFVSDLLNLLIDIPSIREALLHKTEE